jgi:carbon storage regulator CsrA
MLIMSRRKNEAIVINDEITVRVVEIRGDKVRLAIETPKDVPVLRQELYDAIHGFDDSEAVPASPTVSGEQEWLRGERAWELLWFVRERTSERKWWLLALAAWQTGCFRATRKLATSRSRDTAGYQALRRRAEGDRSAEVVGLCSPFRDWLITSAVAEGDVERAACIRDAYSGLSPQAAYELAREAVSFLQDKGGPILHELFGNPFRPVRIASVWRTPDVLTLAGAMEVSDDFDAMPALADALEEAGCIDPAVLGHCRQAEPHAAGCWLIDAILGRE